MSTETTAPGCEHPHGYHTTLDEYAECLVKDWPPLTPYQQSVIAQNMRPVRPVESTSGRAA